MQLECMIRKWFGLYKRNCLVNQNNIIALKIQKRKQIWLPASLLQYEEKKRKIIEFGKKILKA